MRTGNMCIEYNPELLKKMDAREIEERLKIEVIRIILKHPYQRMPVCPNRVVLALASDITIADNYKTFIKLPAPKDYDLPENLSFEEYYAKLLDKLKDELKSFSEFLMSIAMPGNLSQDDSSSSDSSPGNSSQDDSSDSSSTDPEFREMMQHFFALYVLSELWNENNEACEIVNAEIEKAQFSKNWGSLPGKMVELIEASLIIKMDYRRMLSMFRASVLSSKRRLTRNRPNRRYGFEYMGSRYDFTTGLLVAVDVSGSVPSEKLQEFFSIINRFFKYGIEKLDVIQFDAEVKPEILTLKKAKKKVQVTGRGGTSFQSVIDFYESNSFYDGLIFFTDGQAPCPELHRSFEKILWVLTGSSDYDEFCTKLPKLPGSKATYIP